MSGLCMLKRLGTLVIIGYVVGTLFGAGQGFAQYSSPFQELINQVQLDSLRTHVRTLADDTTFSVGDSTYRIRSRSDTTGRKLSRLYLKPKFDSFALAARLDTVGVANEYEIAVVNILAEQSGVEEPAIKVIIGAHYDASVSGSTVAPGADVDASGCAAVLEAARVLSQYRTRYTVVYALWDEGENGRFGSDAYVRRARSRGDSIRGYINLDAIGWDSVQTLGAELWVRPFGQSEVLADSLMALAQRVNTGITVHRIDPALPTSDHYSFWLKGYSAVSLAEEIVGGKGNPYQLSVNDRVEHINFTSLSARTRFALASIAWLASIEKPSSVELREELPKFYALYQNYPNPFNPTTTLQYQLPEDARVSLIVYDLLGQKVATLVDGYRPAGSHSTSWNVADAASGVYFARLTVAGFHGQTRYSKVAKLLLAK